jgi:peroxiredoxin
MNKIMFALFLSCFSVAAFAQEKPEGLFINSKAPDFKGKDQNGTELNLKDMRKQGPVVLVFYRGYWCPYCNKYLKALEDSLELFKEKGAQLVAITLEKDSGVTKTIEKTKAAYSIITDEDAKIMNAYHVIYKVDDKIVSRYKMANIDLAVNNGQRPDAVYLPIPAVYIIGKDGEIKYRFFEPDYKKRASVREILENLNGLK